MEASVHMTGSKLNVITIRGLFVVLTLEGYLKLSKYLEGHCIFYDLFN
jgi:hypothetical protein